MLLHRILTAIVLAVPVVWIILFQSSVYLMVLLLVIASLSAFEWAQLAGIRLVAGRVVFAVFIAAICWFFIEHLHQYSIWYVMISVAWWFGVHLYLLKATPVQRGFVVSPVKFAIAVLVIPAAVLAMYEIHAGPRGGEWLLYGLALVWAADIGAYFSGKRFGKTKLAPNISPGKTKEGLWGAMLATSLYSLLVGSYFELEVKPLIFLLLLSLVLTVISVTGDLYESFLKRETGIKDSGNILPGHGGMLDRIDSVLAAMPVFMIGLNQFVLPLAGGLQ